MNNLKLNYSKSNLDGENCSFVEGLKSKTDFTVLWIVTIFANLHTKSFATLHVCKNQNDVQSD